MTPVINFISWHIHCSFAIKLPVQIICLFLGFSLFLFPSLSLLFLNYPYLDYTIFNFFLIFFLIFFPYTFGLEGLAMERNSHPP